MLRAIFISGLLVISSFSFEAQIEPRPVMTVCEVLSRLPSFRTDKSFIEIRGQWDGNLSDDCPKLQTGNYVWPNEIWTVLPSYPALTIDHEFPIDWDTTFDASFYDAALAGAWAKWERLPRAQKERMTVLATIGGRLDVRADGLSVRSGQPQGYGIQAAWPAQFVVVGIKDIAVAPVQKRTAKSPTESSRYRE